MTTCDYRESGDLEAYFYGERPPAERHRLDTHLRGCAGCRAALEELAAIGDALETMPVVAAPEGANWSGFMERLDARLAADAVPGRRGGGRVSAAALLALAATLTLTTLGVMLAMQATHRADAPAAAAAQTAVPAPPSFEAADTAAFQAVTEEHFERSKLVVLGLAAKDPARAGAADWGYERELAARMLTDTRMYRMAAEDRGLGSIASVMRDLELVLLQASFTDDRDPASLPRIQRLIRRRDLVAKMDAVSLSGL
ncbi:MAG: zf-HC2 domain-containing protein [Acidobacteriota bacterium]